MIMATGEDFFINGQIHECIRVPYDVVDTERGRMQRYAAVHFIYADPTSNVVEVTLSRDDFIHGDDDDQANKYYQQNDKLKIEVPLDDIVSTHGDTLMFGHLFKFLINTNNDEQEMGDDDTYSIDLARDVAEHQMWQYLAKQNSEFQYFDLDNLPSDPK